MLFALRRCLPLFQHSHTRNRHTHNRRLRNTAMLALVLVLVLAPQLLPPAALAQNAQQNDGRDIEPDSALAGAIPLIHVPYFTGSPNPAQGAVFWFGRVDESANFANVRMAYNNDELVVALHIFDRRVTYDEGATGSSDLRPWDAVSLYLDTQGSMNAPLGNGSYRFDAQFSHWQERTKYQRALRWQDGAWQSAGTALRTEAGFRGYPNDQEDDRGWLVTFTLPFAGLGTATPTQEVTRWRMALVLHDRDDVAANPLPDQRWPQNANVDQPSTWGRVAFGALAWSPPATSDTQTVTLRNGVNNVTAPDAAVGGHSECGAQFDPNYFNGWGDANYARYPQINIQNQWDVADWPCYSRYYVTFPLASLPAGAQVVSATLTMMMFGNAGYTPDESKPSFIQAARATGGWDESTLTWNNAPGVLQNYSWTTVTRMEESGVKPATWDVSQAVADALAAGQPLNLALYSSDGDYSSGKYFWSADAGEELRPVLKITYGTAGYSVNALPIKSVIGSGGTATYAINVSGVRPGETVTLSAGPSSPAGLAVTMTPATIAAPGGRAVVSLSDVSGHDPSEATFYTVQVTATSGQETRTTELTVLVNGQRLYLPSVQR